MNRKGFTLIELLAVIVLIALVGVIVFPSVINLSSSSKNKSYDILIDNIVTASENYYMECEYGDLQNENKYGSYACQLGESTITISLQTLAETGFLTVSKDESGNKRVIDPRNNNNISNCQIIIEKEVESTTYKTTYNIENSSASDPKCPTEYKRVNS